MRSSSGSNAAGGVRVGFLVLAVCTLWLVIQNTLLALAVVWSDPVVAARTAMTVAKALALVAAKFWASPAAAALAAALMLALLLRGRPETARDEVHHG
jgi:hypothetical protein